MSSDIKILSKSERVKLAEKHLHKYLTEIKRHFNFSDFQIAKILDNCSQKIRKDRQNQIVSGMFGIFAIKQSLLNLKSHKKI